jgi:hypothetical protein
MSQFLDLRDGIVSTLSACYPDLVACHAIAGRLTYDELIRLAPKGRSLLVALLRSKRGAETGSGEIDLRLRVAAYIVAALDDEASAHQMAAEIAGLVPFQTWGQGGKGVHAALSTVKVKNLHTALTAGQGLTVWAVTWWQPVRLGTNAWEVAGVMPNSVYLAHTPTVGGASAEAYQQVAQNPDTTLDQGAA